MARSYSSSMPALGTTFTTTLFSPNSLMVRWGVSWTTSTLTSSIVQLSCLRALSIASSTVFPEYFMMTSPFGTVYFVAGLTMNFMMTHCCMRFMTLNVTQYITRLCADTIAK